MNSAIDNKIIHSPMRRVLGNLGFLVRGRGIAAAMTLGFTALMARTLGPVEFGLVILIQTYVLLIRGVVNFKQFEAIIKYGVQLHDEDDFPRLRRLIIICKRIDRVASISATILALSLAPFIGPALGMDHQHVALLQIYSLVLLTTGTGTSIGILRLFDKFDTLGRQMTIGPMLRFIGASVAWWLDSTFDVFIVVLTIAYATEELYLNWCGRREFLQNIASSQNEITSPVKMDEFSGLSKFLWITYWQSNLDLVPKHLSVMIAGFILGPTEAGLLRLARQFSSLLAKPAVLIRQVVFVDLTRSFNQGSHAFKLVAYRTALIGGAVGMLFVLTGYLFGESILHTIIGNEFIAAAPVLTLMLLASTFDLTASSLRSACYAIGKAGKVLSFYAITSFLYLLLFVSLTLWLGLIGAGIAVAMTASIPPISMAITIHRCKQVNFNINKESV